MIEVGNENKKIRNKDRCNYFHNMPMLSLLGENHRLPLFHTDKHFIWINETKKRIHEFTIRYIINTGLNTNKTFKEQVEKCMYTTFGEIKQPFIKTTLSKNNTHVFTFIMFYETRGDNPRKAFRVLSYIVYGIIENYVCINYLDCLLKK